MQHDALLTRSSFAMVWMHKISSHPSDKSCTRSPTCPVPSSPKMIRIKKGKRLGPAIKFAGSPEMSDGQRVLAACDRPGDE
ncbi:hypothetical protein JTE90_010681 [Oedothorax gibbosus]|uniref:Uncharacterized protein n=1 Tax=Oedothorax gibbosus TaxID=931172 RepID=A0AAV6UQM1_9ARAC|nr:hypothetical protein JTE90_010681 [Oedothorax gibbosus]